MEKTNIQLYMITGFLGVGKTTLLKNLLNLFKNKKIYLIINEFGKEGIDGDLLRQLNLNMSEISNGSIFCTCKIDKFEDALKEAINTEPDIIIVETSGLSDPTNIIKILSNKTFNKISYKGCLCIVDAQRFEKVFSTATVVKKQLMISSVVILNKIDLVSELDVDRVYKKIRDVNLAVKIFKTSFGNIDNSVISFLTPKLNIDETLDSMDITLQKALVTVDGNMTKIELLSFLNMIKDECYRIKGFVKINNDNYFIDGVGSYIKIEHYTDNISNINKIIFLAGKGMKLRQAIKLSCKWYGNHILEVEF